ncbi:MerR family DNA-binding transcriptional regulator [Streptosporangium sp. NPDC051023]|uniref:MerR family DNA-binding transcriptional regulator n=1 Tax=Streptosporangium sp. NPDC051023 TaxID=3155410 RepID=UPI00344EEF31
MRELLTIGAFARAARLSPKALRLYDELGLLLPAAVDGDSGYRFYIDHGFSGTARRNRAGLDQALAVVWDGSVFTVTKFDRSGRGVLFGLGGSVYDRNDPFGRLFPQTLATVAEFEANIGKN